MPFEHYSSFYDHLYRDKDYEAEVAFLEQVFIQYGNGPVREVLDIGCGTGNHALSLAQRGYRVTGVDRSDDMLKVARDKARASGLAVAFHPGDFRDLGLSQTFDAVISMFAVLSYQTRNACVHRALQTARRHLRPGGLFIFDAWSGPAVLVERPAARIKVVNAGEARILRFASPSLDVVAQTVRVNYTLLRLQGREVLDEVQESHEMRFFFPQEMAYFLEQNGFGVLKMCPFMALDRELTERDWNMTVIAKAIS